MRASPCWKVRRVGKVKKWRCSPPSCSLFSRFCVFVCHSLVPLLRLWLAHLELLYSCLFGESLCFIASLALSLSLFISLCFGSSLSLLLSAPCCLPLAPSCLPTVPAIWLLFPCAFALPKVALFPLTASAGLLCVISLALRHCQNAALLVASFAVVCRSASCLRNLSLDICLFVFHTIVPCSSCTVMLFASGPKEWLLKLLSGRGMVASGDSHPGALTLCRVLHSPCACGVCAAQPCSVGSLTSCLLLSMLCFVLVPAAAAAGPRALCTLLHTC